MTGQEIINKILEELDLKAPSFADNIGVKYQRIFDLQKGKVKKISSSLANDIISKYNQFNLVWLLTGEGDMLKKDIEQKSEPSEITIVTEEEYKSAMEQGLKLLPEVNFKFSAGQTQLICGSEDITRYWFLPDCKDCEGVSQVVGNSMSPTLPSGSWVALKRYSIPTDNPNAIPFGNIFGIVVEDKDTGDYHGHIKILRRYKDSSLSARYWIAHSVNTDEFDDFDIEISQVRNLWIVKQHIVSDIL